MITYTPVQERHARFTVGPGSGGDCAWDLISNLGWRGRRFWSIPDPRFIPLGQQMPKSNISAGKPHPGLAGPEPHCVAQQVSWRRRTPCVRGVRRVPEMDSASLCQADNFACLPAFLSPGFHREMVSFPFPFFAPGHKQSRTKDERKMRWGGVKRGRDI